MSDTEIKNLREDIKSLVDITKNSSERLIAHETRQEILIEATTKLTDAVSSFTVSTVRMEERLVSLESSALDKIENIEVKHSLLDGRVQTLELINANTAGKNEVNKSLRDIFWGNWFKFITLFVICIPVIVFVANSMKEGG